jgi:hypothetical protein
LREGRGIVLPAIGAAPNFSHCGRFLTRRSGRFNQWLASPIDRRL